MGDARNGNALCLDWRGLFDALGFQEFEHRSWDLHVLCLEQNQHRHTKGWNATRETNSKVCDRRCDVLALDEYRVLVAYFLILRVGPVADVLGRSPSDSRT